jgi:hypothetical protein
VPASARAARNAAQGSNEYEFNIKMPGREDGLCWRKIRRDGLDHCRPVAPVSRSTGRVCIGFDEAMGIIFDYYFRYSEAGRLEWRRYRTMTDGRTTMTRFLSFRIAFVSSQTY